MDVQFRIKNISASIVHFTSSSWRQSDLLEIRDATGRRLPVDGNWYSGDPSVRRYRLQPGEVCVLRAGSLGFAKDTESDMGGREYSFKHPVSHIARCKPGRHVARYKLLFPDVRVTYSRDHPEKIHQDRDLEGTVETAEEQFVILAELPSVEDGQ